MRYRPGSRWPLIALLCAFSVCAVLDRLLPDYLPFRSVYLVLTAAVTWQGGTRWGAAIATLSILDLTFIDELVPNNLWATAWALATRIPLYAAVVYLITKQSQDRAKLQELSHTDPLTGLANRRHFDVIAEEELARAARYGRPLTVAILDVNAFKAFNDTEGHVAGDNVLRRLAAEMRSCLRSTDTIARIGGDEFAIVFPETTESQAHTALAAVTKRLAEVYPPGVSVGMNEFQTTSPSVKELLEGSDRAMYRAKRANLRR